MARSRVVALVAAGMLVTGGTVAAAEGSGLLLAAAEDAADEAAQNAGEIAEAATDDATETDDGESQGFGSDAFKERHAMLASKFEERGHPVFDEHPAARVHRALANGEHPTGVGQAQAAAARRMAGARQQIAGERGGPPDHAGRPDQAGRPDDAGPDGS